MPAFDVTYWSWDLFGLAVGFSAAAIQKFWRGYVDRRAETWPVSYGRINRASVDSQDKSTKLKCYYTYKVGTESFVGSFQKKFESSDEANAWTDALDKKQVAVRYDPAHPARSQLREADLEPIVQSAAPFHSQQRPDTPAWQNTLALLGLALSVVGLAVTIVLLVDEFLGKSLPLTLAVWTGSLAWFVFFGGVALAAKDKRKIRQAPAWMKFLGYALLYYTIFVAVVPHPGARRNGQPDSTHSMGRFDARYLLFLYFGAFEAYYLRLQDRDEGAYGIGELR
jgi:hypothetical protein